MSAIADDLDRRAGRPTQPVEGFAGASGVDQPLGDLSGVRKFSGQARLERDEGVDVASDVGDALSQFDQTASTGALAPVGRILFERPERADRLGKARVEGVDDLGGRCFENLRHCRQNHSRIRYRPPAGRDGTEETPFPRRRAW